MVLFEPGLSDSERRTRGYNHKGKLGVRGRFRSMLFAFTTEMVINEGRISSNARTR